VPVIGAPLALAPLNPDPILARATSDAPPAPVAPTKADPVVAPASLDEIRLIQETLADQHLYRGPLDGLFTAELRDAVQVYQRRKGLPETAQLDPETLRRLDADASGEDAAYGAGDTGSKPAGSGR
jgi:peptidoglycan hydrolase-like protein with peptidoglycan-binding domain